MRTWLAAAAAIASSATPAAAAAVQQPNVEAARTVSSFRLPSVAHFQSQSPLRDGMIAQEELAPNAHVGLGLAPMLGRNIRSVRIEQEPVPTKNPGVTFVLSFPR